MEKSPQEPLSNEELQRKLEQVKAERDQYWVLAVEKHEKLQQYIQQNLDIRAHFLSELRKSDRLKDRYMQALTTILALNIPIPDEVFNIANDAINIKGADSNE